MQFDRRAPNDLVEALVPSGPLAGLVKLSRDPRHRDKALDLQLRAYSDKSRPARATLYLGTTKAVDLAYKETKKAKLFRLYGQKGKGFGHDRALYLSSWDKWQSLDGLAGEWPEISRYLRAVIDAAPSERLREGRYQARLTQDRDDLIVIDRELMISAADLDEARGPLQAAVEGLRASDNAWVKDINTSGAKLDAMAIDRHGRVLIIEVKGIWQTSEASRTPAQVALYTRLFRSWAAMEPKAREIIQGMIDQRARLGLAPADEFRPNPKLEFVPVIAFGGDTKERSRQTINRRMVSLVEALHGAGFPLSDLEVWWQPELGVLRKASVGEL